MAILRRLAPFVVLVLVALAGWYGYHRWRGGKSGPTYTTVEVNRSSVLQSVTASGTLSPVVQSTVGSQVSGRITELLVDYNDHVTKGEVLARLDKQVLAGQVTQAAARLTSAQADLARANASAASARLTYERDVAALESGAVSKEEVDTAKANKLVAEAAIATARSSIVDAQAALANAKTNLGYTTITSPIDGIVISRSVDVGQTVAASLQAPELFVIAGDLSKMELHAAVAEADVGQLKDGMRVDLAFDAFPDRTFNGVVEQVRNQATTTQNVVTYDAVVSVDNADGVLRPGMSATATFVVAEAKDVLVVPAKALRYRPASARNAAGGAAGAGAGGRTWGQGQ
ncbi:MAG TPA: efflux RND transporter periplasmic adaptor subunit, partial [Kofleriaceae bacterium]|nr:efflux RND transporter periplasmic adaptor subunit [Kofleriaceae bacterium]